MATACFDASSLASIALSLSGSSARRRSAARRSESSFWRAISRSRSGFIHRKRADRKWAHQDSNLERTGYEPAALTVELWARSKVYRLQASGSRPEYRSADSEA